MPSLRYLRRARPYVALNVSRTNSTLLGARRACFGSCLLLVVFVGCSSKYNAAQVSGTVTLEGIPLAGVTVTFTPAVKSSESPISSGRSDQKGKYRLRVVIDETDGAAIGVNNVNIISYGSTSTDSARDDIQAPSQQLEQAFSFEVKPGKNTADFQLNRNKTN